MTDHNEEDIKETVEFLKERMDMYDDYISLPDEMKRAIISTFNGCFDGKGRRLCRFCEYRADEEKCSSFREQNDANKIVYA